MGLCSVTSDLARVVTTVCWQHWFLPCVLHSTVAKHTGCACTGTSRAASSGVACMMTLSGNDPLILHASSYQQLLCTRSRWWGGSGGSWRLRAAKSSPAQLSWLCWHRGRDPFVSFSIAIAEKVKEDRRTVKPPAAISVSSDCVFPRTHKQCSEVAIPVEWPGFWSYRFMRLVKRFQCPEIARIWWRDDDQDCPNSQEGRDRNILGTSLAPILTFCF